MAMGGADLGSVTTLEDETADSSTALEASDPDADADNLTVSDPWNDNFELTLEDEPSEPPAESADSILASSLEQEPARGPAVEMPAIEVPAVEASATQTPLEAPPIVEPPSEPPPVIETPLETSSVETPFAEAVPAETISTETIPAEIPTTETPPAEISAVEMSFAEVAAIATPVETPVETSVETPVEAPVEPPLEMRSDIDSIEPTRDTVIAETATIPDIEPTRETIIGDSAVIFSGVAVASVDAAPATLAGEEVPEEAPEEMPSEPPEPIDNRETSLSADELADVDSNLAELPEGYGESRIVLLPRDPEWAYAYWDVSNEHKEKLRQQGGQRLMLRLYDVTDLDLASRSPHSMQQVDCHEMARSWYLEMPLSDRDYLAEIGYLTDDERWLLLARSASIRVPPVYPSAWAKDQFVTIDWQEQITGRSFGDLGRPYRPEATPARDGEGTNLPKIYDNLLALTQSQKAQRVAGSLYGSMQQTPPGALSPSGGASGLAPIGLNASGLNVSGLTMSGIGSEASGLPGRSRRFWLVADAELIVYGATEPDATLMVADKVVPLNSDGTFRFHVAFPDGQIDYPIRAIAADGEQTRSVGLHFERETPERDTNTEAEAEDEWF